MKLAPSLRALRVAPPTPYRGQHLRPGGAGSAVFWPLAAPVFCAVAAAQRQGKLT